MMVRARRGRWVACDPACAKCGYDLRGYAVLTRCSECGSNLNRPGAVRRNTFHTSRRKLLAGLGVVALPWLFILFAAFERFAGPRWERLRSNRSLIAEINSNDIRGPWLWTELARRVNAKSMTPAQVSAAVDQLIAYIRQRPKNMPLFWTDPFFQVLERNNAISPSQYVAMAQAFYSDPPRIILPESTNSESPCNYYIQSVTPWDLPGLHREFVFDEISMTGASASTQAILQRRGQGSMAPPKINLVAKLGQTSVPAVPSGKYQVKFIIRTELLPGQNKGGQVPIFIGPRAGVTPLTQWTQTVTRPLDVMRNIYGPNGERASTVLRTDPAADPQLSGALSVGSAEALCYNDVTVAIVHLQVNHVPIWCWSKRKITVNGQTFNAGSNAMSPDSPPFDNVFSCEIRPPTTQMTTADVELDPDVDAANQAYMEQIWGKPIVFKNVPIHRRELGFSLAKWQAEQDARDLKTAAAQLATTRPSPSTAPVR